MVNKLSVRVRSVGVFFLLVFFVVLLSLVVWAAQFNGLLAYFKFDNDNTKDSSNFGNYCTPHNLSYTSRGAINGAYIFSKIQNYTYCRIQHKNPYAYNYLDFYNKSEITMAAWLIPGQSLTDLGPEWDSYIMFKPKNTILLGWSGWSHDGYECNVWDRSNASRRVAVWKTQPQIKGERVHVGCTFNGRSLRLYVNGVLVASNNTINNYRLQNNAEGKEYYDWFIGTKNQYSAQSSQLTWNGIIDEVVIMNKTLSDMQMYALYRNSRYVVKR